MPINPVSSATDTAGNASSDSDLVRLANPQIPVDLFVSKKHPGLPRGVLGFAVASGSIVFRLLGDSTKSSSSNNKKLVLDSNGSPVLSIRHFDNGLWKCYKVEEGDEEKELLFRVKRTSKALTKVELEVFLGDGPLRDDSTCDMKIRGFPYQKSCTIYKGNHVVAQTSLMYKLHQIYVKRSKFRLTTFPGSVDLSLIVALTVIFLEGRK